MIFQIHAYHYDKLSRVCWSRYGIYLLSASKYHAQPNAKHGTAIIGMNKFPYSQKQTGDKQFIPWKNYMYICPSSYVFTGLKAQLLVQYGPNHHKQHSDTPSFCSVRENGRRMGSPFWGHQWRSFLFISHAGDIKREVRVYPVVSQLETRVI